MPVGLAPVNPQEVNNLIGNLLRQFVDVKESVKHYHNWLVTVELLDPPYSMTQPDNDTLKSAIADLDAALDTVNMAVINRLTGLF